jgi:hypothetical protein
LAKILDSKLIERILRETESLERRKRKLPARLMVLVVIAMNLYARQSLSEVLNILIEGIRIQGAYLLGACLPVKSALAQARQRLGVEPMAVLFRTLAHPIAQECDEWAFYKGLKLMALDSTCAAVPDTLVNDQFFGRPEGGKKQSAWPMAKIVTLIEIGTKITVDAFIGSYKIAEPFGAIRLMRSLEKGMLLLWDRGFVGYGLTKRVLATGAHLLGRLQSHMVFKPIETFRDGSFMAKLYPSQQARAKDLMGSVVRIIEYMITDPNRPGFRQRHRLITSLMDQKLYPAKELIVLYHERWEIEMSYDELKTHLIGKTPTLRSQTPLGCLQEIYGLLIAHISIRSLMYEAASKYDLDPDRLSFIDSIRVIWRVIPRMQAAKTELLPVYYAMMLDEIASHLLPQRRNRINPRVIKQKMSNFLSKRFEHYQFPQPKTTFEDSIYVLN